MAVTPKDNPADLQLAMDRYLAGNMSDQERAEFETWIVGNPETASTLKTDRQIRRGLLVAKSRGWLPGGKPAATVDANRTARSLPSRSLLAASVAAMAMVGSLGWWAGEREGLRQASPVPAIAQGGTTSQVVSLGRYRGSQAPDIELALADVPDHLVVQPDVVTLTCDDGSLALACDNGQPPARSQYAKYDVEVIRRVGALPVWHSDLQVPATTSPLTFVIPARDLEAGDYDMLVRGSSATHEEVVGRYWLRIRPGA